MRSIGAVLASLVVLAALTSCSSAGHSGAARRGSSTAPEVVDGITVPPVYAAPAGTVVPGPMTCPADFAATLSTAAGGVPFASTTQLTAHLLVCSYQAPPTSGGCSGARVSVNTEPQAYSAFERWNVEAGQNSMWSANPSQRPTPIPGIGIKAEWAPALLELGTGNDTTWVSVIMTCADPSGALQIAEQLAVEGLDSSA